MAAIFKVSFIDVQDVYEYVGPAVEHECEPALPSDPERDANWEYTRTVFGDDAEEVERGARPSVKSGTGSHETTEAEHAEDAIRKVREAHLGSDFVWDDDDGKWFCQYTADLVVIRVEPVAFTTI